MNVGVYTRYQPRDSTYAALQVADLARACGNHVSVCTTTPRRLPVNSRWDEAVVRAVKFTDWAEHLDMIVWMECPSVDQVRWVGRPRGGRALRKTVLVSSVEDTVPMVRGAYPEFTVVVAPSAAAAAELRSLGVESVVEMPWSPRLPVTVRQPLAADAEVSAHFPLCTAHGRAFDPLAVALVERLLRRQVPANLRVTLAGRSGEVVRRLERRARENPRLAVCKCGDFESMIMHLGEHDLTVLPSVGESFGMIALCSLHAGVPVATYDVAPVDEIVVPGRGGVLVDLDEEDTTAFELELMGLLASRERMNVLRMACTVGLEERAANFEQLWGAILLDA